MKVEAITLILMKNILFLILFLFLFSQNILGFELGKRRRDQFPKEFGYLVVPTPYNIAGLGSGLLVGAGATNIFDSYLDVAAVFISGDIEGKALGFTDLHLISKSLIIDFGRGEFNKAAIDFYLGRGTDSLKEDKINVGLSQINMNYSSLTWSMLDRKIEAKMFVYGSSQKVSSASDEKGNLIVEIDESKQDDKTFYSANYRLEFDFTDDKIDPRRGVRYYIGFEESPAKNPSESHYTVIDHNLTFYIPFSQIDTLAINYFHSDANMITPGETDLATYQKDTGFSCLTITDPEDNLRCESYVNSLLARNKYGTATSLGGPVRLRSYPITRFQGAHSRFAGLEYRWNITEEFTPFNLYFMKDVRTGIQVAFFYEAGSVADEMSDLMKTIRDSYGVGFRVLAGSGYAYRLDLANGAEGPNVALVYTYPW